MTPMTVECSRSILRRLWLLELLWAHEAQMTALRKRAPLRQPVQSPSAPHRLHLLRGCPPSLGIDPHG